MASRPPMTESIDFKGDSRPDIQAVLAEIIGEHPAVYPKKMFGRPGFFTGGKAFVCVLTEGITLKLPPATIASLSDSAMRPFAPGGRSMTGWVEIRREPASEYMQDADLIQQSIAYVAEQAASAEPKPAKVKKAKTS
jgi:TfoX/Sxy family transcriptional regulator of competence genes